MERARVENAELMSGKEKLEERVKGLEAEIASLQNAKEGIPAENPDVAKQAAEQAATIVSIPHLSPYSIAQLASRMLFKKNAMSCWQRKRNGTRLLLGAWPLPHLWIMLHGRKKRRKSSRPGMRPLRN
jgi:cell division septum initiation protein DivIVA